MNQFKTVLAVSLQGGETVPVATAKNIVLSFQSTGLTGGGSGNPLSDGNFDISADLEMVLANGQTISSKMTTISKRLAELETVVANMKNNDPEKEKAQAELTIWQTMLGGIQNAVSVALKANYELQNPVV
ncbi:hypothetical protein [Pedobacter sp.]